METGQDKPVARQLTDFAQVEALYEERLKKDFVRSELRPLSSMRRSSMAPLLTRSAIESMYAS